VKRENYLQVPTGCSGQRFDVVRNNTTLSTTQHYFAFIGDLCVRLELCFSMYCFVLFYVLFVCKCVLLPLGVNPIAVKYLYITRIIFSAVSTVSVYHTLSLKHALESDHCNSRSPDNWPITPLPYLDYVLY
jgi:hypothetical protein